MQIYVWIEHGMFKYLWMVVRCSTSSPIPLLAALLQLHLFEGHQPVLSMSAWESLVSASAAAFQVDTLQDHPYVFV